VASFQAIAARAKRHARPLVALGVALALLLLYAPTLVGHVRLASDHFVFADDVRVLIHPQFRLEDARLFPNDPAVAYFLASLPDGYALLYRALGPLVGVAALSKLLPYLLLAGTLACLGAAAHRLGGAAAVLGTLSLALGSAYVLGRMTGGLPRAFALPLLSAGALALVLGRARLLAALTVLTAGFYPAAALTLGVALTLLLALPAGSRGGTRAWSLRKRALLLVAAGALSALVLLPTVLRLRAWGTAIGPELVHAYPEAGPNGRFDAMDRPPFPALPGAALAPLRVAIVGDGAPLATFTDARAQAAWLAPTFGVLGLLGCAWLARRRVEARRFLLLPLAVVLCHTLSLWLEPRLFLPERYVAYAVPAFALVAIPSALGAWRQAPNAWLRALPWLGNALVLLLLGARGVSWSGLSINVPHGERALYRFVTHLPRDTVIAAFPSETSDSIPYLGRRSVFLARETHMPFHTRYAKLMRTRALKLFRAYFTSSPNVLRELRDREGVTHLLVNRADFRVPPPYFAPFEHPIARSFADGKAHGFAALALASRLRVFRSGDFELLDLKGL